MAYNYEYPYTDPNRYNADWLLGMVKNLADDFENIMRGEFNVYENLDALLASNSKFNIGTVALVLRTRDYYQPSLWRVVETGREDILTHRTAGGAWVRYASKICDVRTLGIATSPVNITEDIRTILESEIAEIYFPEGDYICHMDIGRSVRIYGDGITRTRIIIPYTTFYSECVRINCDNLILEDIHFIAITNNNNVNGIVVPIKCDFSHFNRLRIENFATGFLIQGRFIWNVLNSVECLGGFYAGLYVSSDEAVNTNEFYSCRFDNNVNFGIYMDAHGLSFNNSFYGCTIEQNAQDRFGLSSTSEQAVMINCYCNFEECYFENNGIGNAKENFRVIAIYRDMANFNGCCFITERRDLFYIPNDIIIVNVNGCFQYEQTGNFYAQNSFKTANINGSNFFVNV